MSKSNQSLIYAVRPRVVAKYLGQLIFVAGLLSVVPIFAALAVREWKTGLVCAGCSALMIAVGALLARVRATQRVQQNEMFIITAAVFSIVVTVSAIPFYAQGIGFVDALFESVSGITTTGLSTLASIEHRGFAFLFLRAWLQWLGGLGFLVVSIALIAPSRVAARMALRLFDEESDTISGTRQHARVVATAYGVLTCLAIVVLLLTGLSFRDAVLHALSGVSTGGFAPRDDSIASLNTVQQLGVQLIAVFGALPLAGLYYVARAGRRTELFDGELRLFILVIAIVGSTLFWILYLTAGESAPQAGKSALLLALSAQSTTGFAPTSVSALPDSAKAVLIGSMLTGGEFGSTAGGLKMIRVLLLLKSLQIFLVRVAAPPDAVLEARYKGAPLAPQSVIAAAIMGGLFAGTCFVAWLPFLIAGFQPLDALFEVASALGTVGLSAGITAEDLPLPLKLTLCAAMLLGRLEILAWFVVFNPRSWFGRRMDSI